MSRLDEMVRSHPLPSWRGVSWLIMALLAALVGWSYFAELDEVAIAPAEIVPQGQVKLIQHFEGGIVEKILVVEGQTVKEGDPLVQLDLGVASANREDLQVQIEALMLRRERLQAEANDRPLAVAAAGAQRLAEVVKAERDSFDGRRRQIDQTIVVLRSQARQRELEVRELDAKRRAVEANLRLARQRLAMSKDLVQQDLIAKMEYLQHEKEVETLQGEFAGLEQAVPRARGSRREPGARTRGGAQVPPRRARGAGPGRDLDRAQP